MFQKVAIIQKGKPTSVGVFVMMGNVSSTLARVPDATRSKVEAAISKIHGFTINNNIIII